MPSLPRRAALLGVLSIALQGWSPGAPAAPRVSVPRYTHPGSGQVFYFVLTDRFANGDPANDTGGLGSDPSVSGFDPTRISHFHGGDLKGLTAKLDYIQHLGTTAIWITPPFTNRAMQEGTAGYHGYWILDFLHIDPHLGTDADFREFVAQAHRRGMHVYLDIVVNHTADVIGYRDGGTTYIDIAHAPYRDAAGRPFDEHAVAYNGLNSPDLFPPLSAEKSFAHVPVVAPELVHAKNPDWLNDVTVYHNRGNSHFEGENSLHGDFVGLDDVFTENPRAVKGFIQVYEHWMEAYGIDGYRIDTVRHVNLEFWQAFAPELQAFARKLGRPDFFMFGEVADETGDAALLSEFSNTGTLDASLDFRFLGASRQFVSRGGDAANLAKMFVDDDYFTGPDRNAYDIPTFISNHDAGRFGFFLKEDNPGIGPGRQLSLEKLGYGLLYLIRGQPIVYYGDEQGMTGIGNDMGAREDMFASQSPAFRKLPLLGTSRTGADDKFDQDHPLYRLIRLLAALRAAHPALARGSMLLRPSGHPEIFAFSRVERRELVEYVVALSNSRTASLPVTLPTSQPAGATLVRIFDSRNPSDPGTETLTAGGDGRVTFTLEPMQYAVWRAAAPLPSPAEGPQVAFTAPSAGATLEFKARERDGHTLVVRHALEAAVTGGDGVAEVTFALQRASRPGQFELLGTDDAPPYRVFWRPPSDLARGEILTLVATVDDLRGHRASAEVGNVAVAPNRLEYSILGARVPAFTRLPAPSVTVRAGGTLRLESAVTGTDPIFCQWYHDGLAISGATGPTLEQPGCSAAAAGRYFLQAGDREGATVTAESVVSVGGPVPTGP